MSYLVIGWISASIGFILGAAWAGICRKNELYDQQSAGKLEEIYTKAQRSGM